jgi:hypothetical protein
MQLNSSFLAVALSMKLMEGFHVALRPNLPIQELGRPVLLEAGVALADNLADKR